MVTINILEIFGRWHHRLRNWLTTEAKANGRRQVDETIRAKMYTHAAKDLSFGLNFDIKGVSVRSNSTKPTISRRPERTGMLLRGFELRSIRSMDTGINPALVEDNGEKAFKWVSRLFDRLRTASFRKKIKQKIVFSFF